MEAELPNRDGLFLNMQTSQLSTLQSASVAIPVHHRRIQYWYNGTAFGNAYLMQCITATA